MIKLYLFDIEGTTTDINFVHKVLFPYSYERMEEYVLAHQNDDVIINALENVRQTVMQEENKSLDLHGIIDQLKKWIKEDRKHSALKEIQGLIWDKGYANNHFKGHVYSDVPPFFQRIVSNEYKIGIYSSGPVHAQKLIFSYSEHGDLTPYISFYFDTKVGGKRESTSYKNICDLTHLAAYQIHFFSDISEELSAAQECGMRVTQVSRDGIKSSHYECITDFKNNLLNH